MVLFIPSTKHMIIEFPHLRIPIIFEGDLAHIAACHVKENDYVYITGQLSKHHPWRNANQGEASVQVN